MKFLTFGFGLLAVLFFIPRGTATEPRWSTPAEIERLSVAIALADFPIKQGKLRDVVGIPQHAPPLWGSSWSEGSDFVVGALTDPDSANGYYALRIIYKSDYDLLPEREDVDVLGLDVLFVSPNKMTFVGELSRGMRKALPEFKSDMKKRGLTPREFVAQFMSFVGDEDVGAPESTPDGSAAPK